MLAQFINDNENWFYEKKNFKIFSKFFSIFFSSLDSLHTQKDFFELLGQHGNMSIWPPKHWKQKFYHLVTPNPQNLWWCSAIAKPNQNNQSKQTNKASSEAIWLWYAKQRNYIQLCYQLKIDSCLKISWTKGTRQANF